jgi:hypothetical protein
MGHDRTHAPQQLPTFDHLVGVHKDAYLNSHAQRCVWFPGKLKITIIYAISGVI